MTEMLMPEGLKVTEVFASAVGFSGRRLQFLTAGEGEIVSHQVEIAPKGETGRHKHPGPTYMYILEGTLIVESDDGTRKEYRVGQALVEDAETWFNNRNPGDTPTKFLGVLLSPKGAQPVVFPDA